MDIVQAQSQGIGFWAGYDRRDSKLVSTTYTTELFSKVIDLTLSSTVIAQLAVSSLVMLQSQKKSIASGFLRVSVNAYFIASGAPIPSDFSGMQAYWSGEYQFPHESNLFSGRVSEKIELPLANGRYLVSIGITETVFMPTQPKEERLLIFDRVDLSGIPDTDLTSEFERMISAFGIMANTVTTISGQIGTQITAQQQIVSQITTQLEDMQKLISQNAAAFAEQNYTTVLNSINTALADIKQIINTDTADLKAQNFPTILNSINTALADMKQIIIKDATDLKAQNFPTALNSINTAITSIAAFITNFDVTKLYKFHTDYLS